MFLGRLRNIRWALMFHGPTRSSRNIMAYVHRPDEKTEEHKADPYVPWPWRWPEEHKNISSRPPVWAPILKNKSRPAKQLSSRPSV
jgi:hypothetical protein